MVKRAIFVASMAASDKKTALYTKKALKRLKIKKSDFLVGVDAGTVACMKVGYRPTIAVGDWDSVTATERKKTGEIVKITIDLSREKNRSDLYYAIEAALRMNQNGDDAIDELIVLGALGGRPDHHLATVLDLGFFSHKSGKIIRAYSPDGDFYFISDRSRRFSIKLPHGTTVSLFSLIGTATGVTASGFRYALKAAKLTPSSHGLSNETDGKTASISVKRGTLVMIVPNLD